MYFDIQVNKCDANEIIKFLNSSARDFYDSKDSFKDKMYEISLKAAITSGLTDIERVIRGTFDCDLLLKNADCEALNRMFPNACRMFDISSNEKVIKFGEFLSMFRNINAHAFLSKSDMDFFKLDYTFLQREISLNSHIVFYDGSVTIAGLLYILLNFLREESISNLCKKDFIFGLISSGSYSGDNGERFVQQKSKVDLEIMIAEENNTTIPDALFGKYKNAVSYCDGDFEIEIGSPQYPTFKVLGNLSNNKLLIHAGSLTKTFYREDYCLTISDERAFIELSNQLPPFVLVDLFYEMQVVDFTSLVAERINKEFSFIYKMNRPKFYVDKNLHVLLLPRTASDFRIVSSVFCDSLLKFFLSLESFLYRTRRIDRNQKYSSIGIALDYINTPTEVIKETKYLRNFVAHGYLLDEYLVYREEDRKYTTHYAIKTLNKLLSFLQENYEDVFKNAMKYLRNTLMQRIVSTKYKKIIIFCRDMLTTYPDYDKKDFKIKNGFVNNSTFDIQDLNCFVIPEYTYNQVVKISVPNLDDFLYLNNTSVDNEMLDAFCESNGYIVGSRKENGLLIECKLQKK